MDRVRCVHLSLIALLLLFAAPATAETPELLPHRTWLSFDVPNHRVKIEDEVTVPAGLDALRLGAAFTITGILSVDNAQVDTAVAVTMVTDGDDTYQRLDLERMGLRNGGRAVLVYEAELHESVADVVFSRENVGNEITATIGAEGIYLSAASGWLASADGLLATYELAIHTPEGFETVTQGERTMHQVKAGDLETRWVASHPSDGINLIANRYFVHEEPMREGLTAMTFFLEDDARLRATYLERTKAYIAMYEEMIGPYPYAKFATVENWFPTGYGMPSYTLLGGQVLRLPFIPYTSFGHEIAHNWWGNSVFVDPAEGNWCEGLTVYCADYHYKELESAAAAREYRRNALKDYAAYVRNPDQDFPLREFRSRHSGATRAVGYGKSMFVFHMVDRMIGHTNFLNSLRAVAAEHQFRPTTWSDFMAVFAAAGERDLTNFQAQWLDRAGAPRLSLGEVSFGSSGVELEIRQDEPIYELEIPVVATGADGAVEHLVRLDGPSGHFKIEGRDISQVAVDPDYHLFRRLPAAEIEATISQVLAAAEPVFGMGTATGTEAEALAEAGRAFAADFQEAEAVELGTAAALTGSGLTNVLINPDPELLQSLLPAELKVAGGQFFLGGKRYARDKYDLVCAVPDPAESGLTHLVVLCDGPHRLSRLAGRISHYGKYSWLMLPTGAGEVFRGNWQPGDSPLSATKNAKM